jgi:hypothetical protein
VDQATLNEAGALLQPAVAEASAQQTTQTVVSGASAQETTALADGELEAEQLLEGDVLDVLQNTLAQNYAQVSPSVVNIQVTVQSSIQAG